MNINNITMIDLVPEFMKSDATVKGLCKAADTIMSELYNRMYSVNMLGNINKFIESDLDYIAQESDIGWYHDSFILDQKRCILKNAPNMYYLLGINEAICDLIQNIYGDAEIKEWYEYAGEAFHFKIITSNSSAVNEHADLFLQLLKSVKKCTSILDSIEIITSGTDYIHSFTIPREHSIEEVRIA